MMELTVAEHIARIREVLDDVCEACMASDARVPLAQESLAALRALVETAERERDRWKRAAEWQPSFWADLYREAYEDAAALKAERDAAVAQVVLLMDWLDKPHKEDRWEALRDSLGSDWSHVRNIGSVDG